MKGTEKVILLEQNKPGGEWHKLSLRDRQKPARARPYTHGQRAWTLVLSTIEMDSLIHLLNWHLLSSFCVLGKVLALTKLTF